MSAIDAAASARDLQDRLHALANTARSRSRKELLANIRSILTDANDEGIVSSPLHAILQMFNHKRTPTAHGELVAVSCGEPMDKGEAGGTYLYKTDGSRLSFAFTVHFERHDPGILISYRFHLQFTEGSSPQFIRFDLNPSEAHEPLLEPRFHFHPGSDDMRAQLPPMTPSEVLHKLIYGISNP